jgi:GNAT superfamily N-acetyltransferase
MPITVTRTYLELTHPAALLRTGIATIPRATVIRRTPVSADLFRELYAQVGDAYRWHDRDAWSDAGIEERFAGDRVSIWELQVEGERAGFYELERHDDGSVEIVLFGLLPHVTGQGFGKWLLVDAVDRAWSLGARRVWLHTCTLDSPRALPNYIARGFTPYRAEDYQVG